MTTALTARQVPRNARADVVSKHTLYLLALEGGGDRCRGSK